MAFDPVDRLVAYHAAIDALDFPAIAAMFAEDAVYESGGLGGVVEGRDAIMAGFRRYFDLYPDQVSTDSIVERLDESRARSVWNLVATNRLTKDVLRRAGEEIVAFAATGHILRVEIRDHAP